ncbi:hypothetical protein CLF_113394, partial [Clonorchis sinensis]
LHRESGYADMMNYPAVDGTANPDFITVLPSGEHEVSHSSQSVYEADPRIDLMYQSSHSLPSLPNMRIMNAYDPQGANFIDCRGPICNEQYGYAAHVVSSAIPNSMEERYPIAQSIAEANEQTSLLAPPMAEPYGFSQNLTEVQFPLEVMEYPQIQVLSRCKTFSYSFMTEIYHSSAFDHAVPPFNFVQTHSVAMRTDKTGSRIFRCFTGITEIKVHNLESTSMIG